MLKPFEEVAEPLVLPIRGKEYRVWGPSITDAAAIRALAAGETDGIAKLPATELWRMALGPVWDEMKADGVGHDAVARAGLAVVTDLLYGRDLAEVAWETGADRAALAAYVDQQQAQAPAEPAEAVA